jgi:hypothetical protein
MTKNKLLLLLFIVINCLTGSAQAKFVTTKKLFKQRDTTYWAENVRQFRDALYQGDKTKAKAFFDFPFINDGNELWYLIYSDNEKAFEKLGTKVKSLGEKDFEKYFTRIFPKQFIRCLLKIKIDEILKKGSSESPELKDSTTFYKLYATYSKKERILDLNLATRKPEKISDTEYEPNESSYIYQFTILENGHLKFKRFLIAG